jgi:hypothetical protein
MQTTIHAMRGPQVEADEWLETRDRATVDDNGATADAAIGYLRALDVMKARRSKCDRCHVAEAVSVTADRGRTVVLCARCAADVALDYRIRVQRELRHRHDAQYPKRASS